MEWLSSCFPSLTRRVPSNALSSAIAGCCLGAALLPPATPLQARAGETEDKDGVGEPPAAVLARLETKLGAVASVEADFTQEKSLRILKRKVTIRGRLAVESPGRIAWHVTEPRRYSLIITAGEIRQWDEDTGKVQRIKTDKHPALRVVFQQLTVWFSGHYAGLLDDYDVTVEGESPPVLTFTPKPKSMFSKGIVSVTVTFRDDERYVKQLAIRERGGNTSVLTFAETRLNEPIDDDMWKVRRLAD